jgi:MFS family permease
MSNVAVLARHPNTAPSPRLQGARRLLNRNFMLFWQSQLVSQFGNQAFLIAMMAWTTQATGSATMNGLMMMAGVLPIVLLGPLTGTFADGTQARLGIIRTCDFASGIAVLLLAAGFVIGPADWRTSMLFVTALVLGISQAFFDPAVNAFLPDVVPREELEAANAFRQSSRQVTVLTAQGIGGILYALVGPATLFALNGLSFLLACAGEMFIDVPRDRDVRRVETSRPRASVFFAQAADGFRYVAAQPGMVAFLITGAIFNALLMPISALLPVYAIDYLGADVRWYGFLLAAISAGALGGCTLIGAARQRLTGSSRRFVLIASFGLLAIALIVLGQVRLRWLALAIVFATGALAGIINVLVVSLIQRRTSAEYRGRVLGLHATMTRVLIPLGLVGGGAVADLTGRNVPLVYATCGALALLAVTLLGARRTTRAFLASA